MLKALWIILLKETRDLLRDRRTLFFLFAPPLLAPLMAVAAIGLIGWQVLRQAPEGLPVAIEGAERAPALVAYLTEIESLQLVDLPPDPAAALQSGELMALLSIPPDAPARLETELPLTLTLTTSRVGWLPALADMMIRVAANRYGEALLTERLDHRGLAPDWIDPVRLVDADAPTTGIVAPSTPTAGAGMARSFSGLFVPFIVASWSMGGGLGLISYMTVGEKERATMEPLLVTVASRVGIVLGKIILSMIVSLVTIGMWSILGLGYLLLVHVTISIGAGEMMPAGMQAQALGAAGLWVIVLMLPLMTTVSGLTAAVCAWARNYREANLFMAVLQLGLPAVSFAAVFIVPAQPGAAFYALPLVGTLIAVRDLFLQGLSPAMLALSAICSVIYAALSIVLAAYVFSRDWALMRGL